MSGSKSSDPAAAPADALPRDVLQLTVYDLDDGASPGKPAAAADAALAEARMRRGRRVMLLILLACSAPVVAAYLAFFVVRWQGKPQHGTLIQPTRALPARTLATLDGQPVQSLSLKGQWLLVVVAGAELFTGNNLLAMAWADGKISSADVLRNWVLVCLANLIGAAGLAALVFASGHTELNGGAIAQQVVKIALAKQNLPWEQAFFRGVLCNVLVCMAVWMAMAGRSVTDKAVAIVMPITAFVAAGFEHSIANMYFFPLAMLVQAGSGAESTVTWVGMATNLVPVIAGNLLGGSVLVGLTYYVIYRRGQPQP